MARRSRAVDSSAALDHFDILISSLRQGSLLEHTPPIANPALPPPPSETGNPQQREANVLLILLPLLIVLSTLLFLILVFLVFVLVLKRKSRIRLGDEGGPVDLSVGDGVWGEGGVDGVEARWLESVDDDDIRRGYRRAKDWQLHHPPLSVPTDITLSQYLTIQEKGVSAWSFEADYESNMAVYVQGRTEITFLDGPGMPLGEGGGNSVLSNLPLPKLNEVYYFECKMYDKPETTEVAIGLVTKPYPSFRLPGLNRYSVAYGSDGFRTHNYPFTTHSYGPPLKEGDVLGVGYRPRTGTVFFTRNGRKHEDCFVGLQRFNLFPCVGSRGPATVHVNLGQAGFVFIEANVKKWGLAPSMGTLAPPPAYGSERGSILLESGAGARRSTTDEEEAGGGRSWMSTSSMASASRSTPRRSSRRSRRSNKPSSASTTPVYPSPLRTMAPTPEEPSSTSSAGPVAGPGPSSVRRARERGESAQFVEGGYVSPVDRAERSSFLHPPDHLPSASSDDDEDDADGGAESDSSDDVHNHHADHLREDADEGSLLLPHNPPTPNLLDISLSTLRGDSFFGLNHRAELGGEEGLTPYHAVPDHRYTPHHPTPSSSSASSSSTARPRPTSSTAEVSPPGYSPLDPVVYANGVPTDLPASVISAAFEAEDRADALARQRARELLGSPGGGGRADEGEGVSGWVDGVRRWWRGGYAGEGDSPV